MYGSSSPVVRPGVGSIGVGGVGVRLPHPPIENSILSGGVGFTVEPTPLPFCGYGRGGEG